MAFHDVQFPPDIAFGATGGPRYSTSVIISSGGHEQRNANWSSPQLSWNVASGVKSDTDWATLIAFFRAREGRAHGFRFKDWSDYMLARQTIGTTDGSDATWQLFKNYTSGSTTKTRNITRPVSGSVRVWVDGTERTLGAGSSQFQVNLSTGIITLGSTLAALSAKTIEASCQFDVPVRFDTDRLDLRLSERNESTIWAEWAEIPVVELRE